MPEMNQGDSYKEEASEVMEDATKIKLPNKKVLLIIGAVACVAVLSIGVTMVTKGQASAKAKSQVAAVKNVVSDFKYTAAETSSLRAAGYTGDEIELSQKAKTPSASLLSASKAARDTQLKNQYKEISDNARKEGSPEYLELLNMTWLSNALNPVANTNVAAFTTEKVKYIAQYVKPEARGHQLQIKVTLDDGTFAFMTVHPSRWMTLKDSGAILIQYDKIKFGASYYIMNLVELPV